MIKQTKYLLECLQLDKITGKLKVVKPLDMSSLGSGNYTFDLKDAVADALSIRRGTTDMVVFDSNTPKITITPAVDITGALSLASDIDMSASSTGTYDIILKDAVADALSIRRASTDMIVFDSSTPKVTITPNTTITGLLTVGGVTIAAGTNRLIINGVASSGVTDGSVIRMGTSGSPLVDDQAGAGFIVGYFDSGDTTGWPAGLYISTDVTGAGGSFTALQGDAVIKAAKAVVTGIESFMQLVSPGKVTGAARACQATVDFGNYQITTGGGVYSGACFNMKGEGSSCDPSLAQRMSCLELKTEGTFATDKDFEKQNQSYAIYFNGFTAGAGVTQILTSTNLTELAACNAVGVRIGVGGDADAGASYYIPLIPAADWN